MTSRKFNLVAGIMAMALAATAPAQSRGDVNGDGAVNTQDLTMVVQALSEGLPYGAAAYADVNRDRELDARDVSEMLRLLAGGRGNDCDIGRWPCCGELPPEGCCGDEICEEDNEEDPGGGPGGFDPEGPGDIPGGGGGGVTITQCDDCSDFEVRGPNYAGPGDLVWATAGIHWNFCRQPVTAEVISGAHLLTNGIYAGDTPGTVRIRVSVELLNGTVCSDVHEVQIVRYEPVRLRYATFIECPLVANPAGWIPTVDSDYFGGDDRGPSAMATSYRSCHEIEVAPHQFAIAGSEVFPYDLTPFGVMNASAAPFGQSTGYAQSQVTPMSPPGPCPMMPLAGATPVTTANLALSAAPMPAFGGSGLSFAAGYSGNHASYVRRIGSNTLRVYHWVAGSNPLFVGAPASNGFVQWTLYFLVDSNTGQKRVHVQYYSIHNAYPAQEMYANGISLYGFSPLAAGTTPLSLGVPLNEFTSPSVSGNVQIPNQ